MTKRRKLWLKPPHNAIQRGGRVRRFLRRKYGDKAFKEDDTIKLEYLNEAIKNIGTTKRGSEQHSLKMALILAKRLKKGL